MYKNEIFIVTSKNEMLKTILTLTIVTYIFAAVMYKKGYDDGKNSN